MRSKSVLIVILLFLSMNIKSYSQNKYPVTKKVKQTDTYFGQKVEDPYRWLEDDKSKETSKWVEEQNKTTQEYLSKIPYRNEIKECLTNLWNFEKYGLPLVNENFLIFSKNNGIQNQSVLYITKGGLDEAKILIDPNTLSKDGTVALNDISVSNDGKYIAYTISSSGSDWNEINVMKSSGEKLSDNLKRVKFSSIAWRSDGFYYSRYDVQDEKSMLSAKNEYHKVYYHRIGTSQSEDMLIFEDNKFPLRNFNAITTDDEKFLFISQTESTNGNSLIYRRFDQAEEKFVELTKGFDFNYKIIGNIDEDIIILTDKDAPRYRLVKVNLNVEGEPQWTDIVPQSKDVLQSATIAGDKIILTYMSDAKSKLVVHDFNGTFIKEMRLPEIGTITGVSGRKHHEMAYFAFQSFTTPLTIYSLNMNTLKTETVFAPILPIKTGGYVSEQVFYTSKDGTKIPMFIVRKKEIKLDGNNPLLLYGYGGFNISLTPSFSISRLYFIESGGIYAVANIRGGGEYGSEWHKAGTKLTKQNTFDDFIAAAEYLIKNKYTISSKLAIQGGSNGGLLVGACMTQRPDLFKVALPAVGVLDMLRYHKFTIGWAWKTDYGSSENEKEFKYIYKYSPLHNIKTGVQYPATLVTTADHDDRVVPAHSFKFIATLQEKQSGKNPVLIRIETNAGHGAGKPTAKAIEEAADIWAFTFFNLNMPFKNICEKIEIKKPDDGSRPNDSPVITPQMPVDRIIR